MIRGEHVKSNLFPYVSEIVENFESMSFIYTLIFVFFRMYRKTYHMVGLAYPAAVIVTLKVKSFHYFHV